MFTDRLIPAEISNWTLSDRAQVNLFKAKSEEELKRLPGYAADQNLKIIAKGAGCSFGNIFYAHGQISVDTSALNAIHSFSQEHQEIEVGAGLRITDLLTHILPNKLCLSALSGSMSNTIGGMLSSNVHGKDSWKLGNFEHNILAFQLLTADGNLRWIDRNSSELFNAVIGGLGLFGLITRVRLKLQSIQSTNLSVRQVKCKSLHHVFEHFENLGEHDRYAYAWVNATQKSTSIRALFTSAAFGGTDSVKTGTSAAEKHRIQADLRIPERIYGMPPATFWKLFRLARSCGGLKAFFELRYRLAKRKSSSNRSLIDFQYVWRNLPEFNQMYAPNGAHEIQCWFPKENAASAIEFLLQYARKNDLAPEICVIKKHRATETLIGFGGDGYSVTMNYPLDRGNKDQLMEYARGIYEICLSNGGKVYLAKHPFLSLQLVKEMYGNFDRFTKLKRELDPDQRFVNDAWLNWMNEANA